MVKTSRRNNNRIREAAQALAKVKLGPSLPSKKIKKNRPRTAPPAFGAPPDHVARYIHSLYADELEGGLLLPTSNYLGPYAQMKFRTQLTLLSGAAAPGVTGVLVNPYHLWTNMINIDRITNNAVVSQPFYTCLSTSTATGSSRVFDVGNYNIVSFSNQYTTSATTGFQGWCRPHGIKFNITYVGTELGKGGEIVAFTNPKEKALCNVDSSVTTAVNPMMSVGFPTLSSLQDGVSIHRMGDRFSFVWRPSSMDFRRVETNIVQDEFSIATLNAENSKARALGIITPSDEAGAAAPMGWTTGFVISPATATTGANSNYLVEIEAVYDLSLSYTEASSGSATNATSLAYSHPAHEAAVRNALAHVHHTRANSATKTAQNLAISAGKRLLSGAVEGLGERIAASFA